MGINILVYGVGIALGLLASALFSAGESAVFSLGTLGWERLKRRRRHIAPTVRALLDRPRRLLVTVVVGNTLAVVVVSSLATSLATRAHEFYGPAVAAVITTLVVFVWAETVPKTIGVAWAPGVAAAASPFISFMYWALYPLNRLVLALTKKVGVANRGWAHEAKIQDLLGLLELGEREGVVDEAERLMIARVMTMNEVTAGDIATPRVKIFALSADTPFEKALTEMQAAGFARAPVCDGDLERIVGIVYAKDLLIARQQKLPPTGLRMLCRPTHFVPSGQTIINLLRYFIINRSHIAIVVDEYGAVDGLVTMSDILKKLIGPGETTILRVGANSFVVPATALLEEFNEIVGVSLTDEEADTVGGYVMNRLGHLPCVGEEYREAGLVFTVTDTDRHKLKSFLVYKLPRVEK